jgi:hypothetical protein
VYPVLEDLIVNNENVTIKFDANGTYLPLNYR